MKAITADLLLPIEDQGFPRSLLLPLAAGMAFNLASLAVANPYLMLAIGSAIALILTLVYLKRPSLGWVAFVATCAASPANLGTPIATNILCALCLFAISPISGWKRLPGFVKVILAFALLSTMVSILASSTQVPNIPSIRTNNLSRPRPWMMTWSGGVTFETLINQAVSSVNYLLGPFLLIPFTFSRITKGRSPEQLLRLFLLSLVIPSLIIFFLARNLGHPIMSATEMRAEIVNISAFRLGKLDIQMLRTQVGIIIAALLVGSFSVVVSPVQRLNRCLALACLLGSLYLLLTTGSVGSTFAALIGMTLVLLLNIRRFSWKRYFAIGTISVLLTLVGFAALPPNTRNYAYSRYEARVGSHGSSMEDRTWRWRKAANYMLDNPSGTGWSLWVEPLNTFPHNDFLSYGIAFGMLCGFLYFLLPFLAFLSLSSFAFLNHTNTSTSLICLASAGAGITLAVMINSMSDHMTADRWYFNVAWSLVWFCYFACRPSRTSIGNYAPPQEPARY